MKSCEDCGERATRKTADGFWLCEGDFDALLEAWDSIGREESPLAALTPSLEE